ncbi:MAG: hypothetical protein ABSA84_06745 [Gammaproteobacteria bacterium]|jgi:hypothetical protein
MGFNFKKFIRVASGGVIGSHHLNPKEEFKEAIKTVKDADHLLNPGTGTLGNPIFGKRARELEEKGFNEATGARKRNHKRLDDQKQQSIDEAMRRIRESLARDENIRTIVINEAVAFRNANGSTDADNIPNPILAYEACILGETAELATILNLASTDDAYISFMNLNPLNGAYLAYIDSDLKIDALKMLSEHNNASLIAAKMHLQTKLWQNIDNAIRGTNFDKVKRIISAFVYFKGEDIFLREVKWKLPMHQPLINNRILQSGTNGLVFSEEFRNRLNDVHRVPATTSLPRPRLGM